MRARLKIWDLATRLFHVALIISLSLSLYSGFEDKFDIWGTVHLYAGFTVLGLMVWRVLWIFLGSETNGLSGLLASPRRVLRYISGRDNAPLGHNPLGGYAVLAMILLVLVQSGLGLFADDDIFFAGPLSAYEDILPFSPTGLHKRLGWAVIGLIALHICAVAVHRFVFKEDIVRGMITGEREVNASAVPVRLRPTWIGLASLFAVTGFVLWRLLTLEV